LILVTLAFYYRWKWMDGSGKWEFNQNFWKDEVQKGRGRCRRVSQYQNVTRTCFFLEGREERRPCTAYVFSALNQPKTLILKSLKPLFFLRFIHMRLLLLVTEFLVKRTYFKSSQHLSRQHLI
jgi:hypothetical protein